jgi:ATP-binding cassette, subfamily B, bacterial PglK
MNSNHHRLWRTIAPKRKRQFGLLTVLMVLASFAEILTVSAVIPFLGVLTNPDKVFAATSLQPLFAFMGITSADQLLLPITVGFIIATLLASAMRVLLIYAQTRFSFAIGADISLNAYHRTLHQPYAVHIGRNSSQVIAGLSGKVMNLVNQSIIPIVTLISSVLILAIILTALLLWQPLLALSIALLFGIIYGVILRMTKRRLAQISRIISTHQGRMIKAIQESLGGVRDIIIDGTQKSYNRAYREAVIPLRTAQANAKIIGASPSLIIQGFIIAVIAAGAYLLVAGGGSFIDTIPLLGALAVGIQRILPLFQQAYNSITQLRSDKASFTDVLDLVEQPLPASQNLITAPITFQQQITLRDLSFTYHADAPPVLHDINLTLKRGGRYGFIGTTGSGKSTLLDIIMGLLPPTRGALVVDDQQITASNTRAWQAHIAHVPQAIFLADATVAENIAFGLPIDQIDLDRVAAAARQAQIADTIATWPQGYHTHVGERGVKLSGGQRQRIGIARALYKQADVIIFDEATSALDNDTESAVMMAIDNLSEDLTILIVAHRLTTLRRCDQIISLQQGRIAAIGSYDEMVGGGEK